MKPVAVIILNWNGLALLQRFLPSVVDHTPGDIADVIVADNGSTDGSIAYLRSAHPEVRLIEFHQNHGFAGGYNLALREIASGYRYALLLNSDVEVKPGWLTPLYDFMLSHPRVAAVQPKIKSVLNPAMFEYAGASGGFLDCHGFPYCRGRIFNTIEPDTGQYDTAIQIHWASGAALMVEIDAYLKVGGLDPDFFAHMEEIDLCWRLRLDGRQIWAVPQAQVFHLGGGSLPASNPRKTYLNFRNNLLMLHKNLPDAVSRGVLFRRRLLDTIAWAKFLITGQWADARAIIKAHRDFLRLRSAYTSPKPKVNLLAHTPNILIQYYLCARRTFGRLQATNLPEDSSDDKSTL